MGWGWGGVGWGIMWLRHCGCVRLCGGVQADLFLHHTKKEAAPNGLHRDDGSHLLGSIFRPLLLDRGTLRAHPLAPKTLPVGPLDDH